jgi:hypothetical protein
MKKSINVLLKLCLFAFSVVLINSTAIYARDLRITTSPNPAIQGEKIRFTLSTDISVIKASIVFPAGKLSMNKIDKSLYTTNFWVPENQDPGTHAAKLYVQTQDDKALLFFIKYDVISKPQKKRYQQNKDLAPKVVKSLANADLNIRIDQLEDNLDLLEKDKLKLKNKIDSLKNDIEKMKNRKNAEEMLTKKSLELEKLEAALKSQQTVINKGIKSLKGELLELSKKEEQLQIREEHITKREQNLAKKEISLAIKADDLKVLSTRVSKKETVLSEKEKEINTINTKLKKKEVVLASQIKRIQSKRTKLQTQEKELNKFQTEIKEAKREINIETVQLNAKEKELTNKEQNLTEKGKKQIYLFTHEKKALELKKENISLKDQLQKKKHQDLEKLADDLHSEYNEFSRTRDDIQTLSIELDKKQNSLNTLKYWITNKTEDLKRTYKQANMQSEEDLLAYQEEYSRLSKYSKLLQDRSKELQAQKQEMQEKNIKLERHLSDIEHSLEAEYRYGFAPYIGFHSFNFERNLSRGAELGINLIEYTSKKLSIEGGLGLVSTSLENDGNKGKIITVYDVNLLWDTLVLQKDTNLFLSAGIGGDFEDGKYFSLSFGATIKFLNDKSMLTRLNYRTRSDSVISLGFENRIKVLQKVAIAKEQTAIPAPVVAQIEQPVYKTQLATSILLDVPTQFKQHVFKKKTFLDIKKHWAESDIINLSSLGVISGKSNDLFDPKGHVTRIAAAKLLTLTAYIHNKINIDNVPIKYSIIDIPGIKYIVNLSIVDSQGKLIKNLIKDKEHFAGNNSVPWTGLDNKGVRVKHGTYTVTLAVSQNGKMISNKSSNIDLLNISTLGIDFNSPEIGLKDIPMAFWGKKYINKAIQMKIFAPFKDSKNQKYFSPGKPLKKIDFIIAIGKTLDYLGAINHGKIKLTYKDKINISKADLPYIELYISTLGYGGDKNKKLNANKLVTRAEAVVMLARLLKWRDKDLNQNISFISDNNTLSDKNFKVTVGVFLKYEHAADLKKILAKFNIPTIIIESTEDNQAIFNVEAGIFKEYSVALNQVKILKKKGFAAFVQEKK